VSYDRTKAIHASDVGPILGISPFSTPYKVWREKTGEIPPPRENRWMKLGQKMEPIVAEDYEEATGYKCSMPSGLLTIPDVPLAGTPDRFVDAHGVPMILEIKTAWTPRSQAAWGEEGTGMVPPHYAAQALAYMALASHALNVPYDRADFAVLMGGITKFYTVRRDEENEKAILEYLHRWWNRHVVKGDPPPRLPSEEMERLSASIKKTTGNILTVDGQFDEVARRYIEAKNRRDLAEHEMEEAQSVLCSAIADADGMESPTFRATWKFANMSPKVDYKSIVSELKVPSELLAKHTSQPAPSRRFLLKETRK
jgi:putative phage-type endonuclease